MRPWSDFPAENQRSHESSSGKVEENLTKPSRSLCVSKFTKEHVRKKRKFRAFQNKDCIEVEKAALRKLLV